MVVSGDVVRNWVWAAALRVQVCQTTNLVLANFSHHRDSGTGVGSIAIDCVSVVRASNVVSNSQNINQGAEKGLGEVSSEEDDLLLFADLWRPFGGPPEEDVFEYFGFDLKVFDEKLRKIRNRKK